MNWHWVRCQPPPTPEAGLTETSNAASSGNSSLLCTSMGPFTAAITEQPLLEYEADPSARWSRESAAVISKTSMQYRCSLCSSGCRGCLEKQHGQIGYVCRSQSSKARLSTQESLLLFVVVHCSLMSISVLGA